MQRPAVAVDPGFGAHLRQLRDEREWSLRRLGKQIHCSHGYLWDLEAGRKRPSLAVAALLDEALGAGGHLAGKVTAVSADSGARHEAHDTASAGSSSLEFAPDWRQGTAAAADLWRADMQRRDHLEGLGFHAAAFLAPALRWLTTPVDEGPVGHGIRLIGEPDIEMVRRLTEVFRGLDNQYGGGHVRDSVVRFLGNEVSELLRGRYDARTGAALFSAAAEATQLAAWASYDIGAHGLAQRYLIQALRLAATAGDRPLGAEILAAMSHQAGYLRASAEAVDLARVAGQAAAEVGATAIQAEAAVLEAHGHAVGGDEPACAAALDRAERTFDRADRTSSPHWIGYFDDAYLSAKFGHCFATLGRGDLAARFAASSLAMDGRAYVRGRQFNLALLAVAHVQSGDPEQAGVVGVQAVDAAVGLRSQRALDYLADLADRLAPYAGLAAVQQFTDRVRPVVGSV